ncbi:MAG: site-2 protease family protein [Patescibacteria group bacterium]
MQGIELIFSIAVLIFSVIVHELAHGYTADYLGDPTARLAGRLTWNPLSHLDAVGSLLVPLFSYTLGGFVFGWAKPVPYNPYNLRNQKWGTALVAVSGAAANLLIALFFSLVIRYKEALSISSPSFIEIAGVVIFLNILLAVFNLIPIPPLDGSKVLFSILPHRFGFIQEFLEKYSLVLIIFLIFFLWRFFIPLVYFLYSLFTGAWF